MSVIEIKKFVKNYGSVAAVKGIDLSVDKGLIVGFVGKNGAGKSTTLRTMLNILNPTQGSIKILGLDSEKHSKNIKARVSYVPSESAFYDNITCEKLLLFALGFTDTSVEEMRKISDYFELDLCKKVQELSFGNRKKLSLVQGFIKNAELIILDEPTNGLDPLMQNKFFELLLKEKQKGKTVFLSSHNLNEIEKYCDKVAVIVDGEIADYFDMKDVKIKYKQIVSYTTKDGVFQSYEVEGDINLLVQKLAEIRLESLEIKNKTAIDEFMSYYEK